MFVYLRFKLYSTLQYPDYCTDFEFKNLINHMLVKKLMNRMSKISQIKTHIWFKDFNWEDLISLKMTPPYQPTLSTDNYKSTEGFIHFMENHYEEKVYEKSKATINTSSVISSSGNFNNLLQFNAEEWFKQF